MCQKSREKTRLIKLAAGLLFAIDIFLQTYLRSYKIGLENMGVSFGLAAGWGRAVSFLAYAAMIWWYFWDRQKTKKDNLGLFLIALGGLGNLLNRIIWGSVWDYISLPLFPFNFNLADFLISLGVVSYILGGDGNRNSLRRQRDDHNQ